MAQENKRKDPSDGHNSGPASKKKRNGATDGRWKTPNQRRKESGPNQGSIEPGDVGIWATCARGQERRATRELLELFEEAAESLYGLKAQQDVAVSGDDDEDGGSEDIEESVKKELESMEKAARGQGPGIVFTPVRLNFACLIFVKTRPPVQPVRFVHRICQDAVGALGHKAQRKSRYLNRLIPCELMGKASENGVVELAQKVLAPWFDLSGKRASKGEADDAASAIAAAPEVQQPEDGTAEKPRNVAVPRATEERERADASDNAPAKNYSFAIRTNIRNHNTLTSNIIIEKVAGLINNDRHKVDLKAPDKVILIDVFRHVCGMSILSGDWDQLRRYNLTELYAEGLRDNAPKEAGPVEPKGELGEG